MNWTLHEIRYNNLLFSEMKVKPRKFKGHNIYNNVIKHLKRKKNTKFYRVLVILIHHIRRTKRINRRNRKIKRLKLLIGITPFEIIMEF